MNRHKRLELVAGDDWQLDAVMLDPTGKPLDLTNAVTQWTLLDAAGYKAVAPGDFTIQPGTDPGSVTVKIAASHSTRLPGGNYSDYWRVTSNNITQTLLRGIIGVMSDPFVAPAEPALIPNVGTMQASESPDIYMSQSTRTAILNNVSPFRGRKRRVA